MRADFKGQTVLVTGASRGIGLAIAGAFAAAGADLHLLADDAAVEAAAASLGAHGHIADITDEAALGAVFAGIAKLDILVNNAGLERLTPIDDDSPENAAAFRRVIEINVVGTFLVTRAALKRMAPGGRIVNTASIWGRVGEPLFSAYVGSKHAVIGLTKSWAKELGPRRIAVNAVAPGWVRTEASLRSLKTMAERAGEPEADLLADIVGHQAFAGLMEPDDVTGPYLFLASSLAANITGQTLGIDRGEAPW
jgi:3-hydroxybutyrate dehydrogenase